MRKQNRNNRICTNEESGKTDFIIDPLLPIGKENAITTQELMRISGCGSSRELRQRIALVEPLFVQDQGVDTGSRKTGRKYKSL